jgi:hypothetical protein
MKCDQVDPQGQQLPNRQTTNPPQSLSTDLSTTRRRLVAAGGGVAALSALGFPAIVSGQQEKIRLGHLTPMTGFLGALGEYAVMGIRMAACSLLAPRRPMPHR